MQLGVGDERLQLQQDGHDGHRRRPSSVWEGLTLWLLEHVQADRPSVLRTLDIRMREWRAAEHFWRRDGVILAELENEVQWGRIGAMSPQVAMPLCDIRRGMAVNMGMSVACLIEHGHSVVG